VTSCHIEFVFLVPWWCVGGQGSFVVCRIFQKSGSGPQNGAQYGAPFVEEEWEEAEDLVPKSEGASEVLIYATGEQEYAHPDDFEQVHIFHAFSNKTLQILISLPACVCVCVCIHSESVNLPMISYTN